MLEVSSCFLFWRWSLANTPVRPASLPFFVTTRLRRFLSPEESFQWRVISFCWSPQWPSASASLGTSTLSSKLTYVRGERDPPVVKSSHVFTHELRVLIPVYEDEGEVCGDDAAVRSDTPLGLGQTGQTSSTDTEHRAHGLWRIIYHWYHLNIWTNIIKVLATLIISILLAGPIDWSETGRNMFHCSLTKRNWSTLWCFVLGTFLHFSWKSRQIAHFYSENQHNQYLCKLYWKVCLSGSSWTGWTRICSVIGCLNLSLKGARPRLQKHSFILNWYDNVYKYWYNLVSLDIIIVSQIWIIHDLDVS